MKLGIVSAIFEGYSFEEMMDKSSEIGFSCVEVACWPFGKAERRYAGVSHIDVDNTKQEYLDYIKDYSKKSGVEISSLAYYPNTLDSDLERREININHLKKVINMSSLLGVNVVTTFVGRDQHKNVEQNIEIFKTVWPDIIKYAESLGVKVAIENCPMLFDGDQWPGGQNLMTTPDIWKKLFEIIPSPNFGLNYDPSHFVWQQIDYIAPIYDFKDRIIHVHFKDIKLHKNKLNQVGVMAYPLEYMSPKLPGLGDVDWGKYVSALTDIGYDGFACIEIEDKAFEQSRSRVIDAVTISKKYMEQFVI